MIGKDSLNQKITKHKETYVLIQSHFKNAHFKKKT